MKATAIDSQTQTWRNAKMTYLSLAMGLILAMSAVAGLTNGLSGQRRLRPDRVASTRPATGSYSIRSPQTVVFYLVRDADQAALAVFYEEHASWVRYDAGVPEPARSVHILKAGTWEEDDLAHGLIDDSMAAANFVGREAPSFQVVDLR